MNEPKPSKIAILLPNLRGGGAERVNLDLAHEFARQGHTVDILLMRADGDFLSEATANFTVVDLKCPRARSLPIHLARYLRSAQPDALLAGMWPLTVIAPLMRLAGYRGRVVVSEHGILSAQYKSWGRLHRIALRASMAVGYRFAAARLGVSKGVADDMAALSGLPRQKFDVIYNPIKSHTAPIETSPEIEALWGVPPGGRIVTVGRMKAVKNHPLLIKAFAKLNRPDARLMFVGTGDGEAELRDFAANLGVADRVIFAGFRTDPTPFYHSADLFVLSSNYEGFGNVIVEAMACGTSVVSTDCPSGPAEILEDGKYGGLVPVGDSDALAKAIDAALDTPHDPAALRKRALDFAPDIAATRYLELLGV